MVGFIAVLEQTPQLQQFWCVNCNKNPNIDREIKYLDFVSGHLASAAPPPGAHLRDFWRERKLNLICSDGTLHA
jgi:hypothetical protein